jgi:hypothetical protein
MFVMIFIQSDFWVELFGSGFTLTKNSGSVKKNIFENSGKSYGNANRGDERHGER